MKAVVKTAPQPGAIAVQSVDSRRPAPGEVLIEVQAASICGSDLHIHNWDPIFHGFMHPPMVLGHEFAGRLAEIGADVEGLQSGQLVMAESVLWCGSCRACLRGRSHVCERRQIFGVHRPGGMAETVIAPARFVHPLPDGMNARQGAVVEPLTVALHAVLAQPPRPGDVVLVTGPGPIGLLAGQVARAMGAHVFVAGAPADAGVRLPLAESIGLSILDPGTPPLEALGQQADMAIDASGSEAAIQGLIPAVANGGSITLVGLFARAVRVDLSALIRREISVRTSYIGSWDDFERAIGLLRDGVVQAEQLLAPYALDDAVKAFDDALAQRVMKPLLLVQ
ncbi:MAG TPA: alcohol dehydrogenase catalytic domain-containing protein [Chloroflexota bacterium]